jgi:hypothetical protein
MTRGGDKERRQSGTVQRGLQKQGSKQRATLLIVSDKTTDADLPNQVPNC